MRFWAGLAAALLLAWPEVASAQPNAVRIPGTSAYTGPPPSIDGPRTLSPVVQPWLDPSSSAVVLPEGTISDGENAESLALPGDSVMEGLPPDHILVAPQEFVAPPQKISAYKNSFFQKLSLAVDYLGNEGDPADLGITEVQTFVQVGLPAPIKEWP